MKTYTQFIKENLEEFQKEVEDAANKMEQGTENNLSSVVDSMKVLKDKIQQKQEAIEKIMNNLEKLEIDAATEETKELAQKKREQLQDKVDTLKTEIENLEEDMKEMQKKSDELKGMESTNEGWFSEPDDDIAERILTSLKNEINTDNVQEDVEATRTSYRADSSSDGKPYDESWCFTFTVDDLTIDMMKLPPRTHSFKHIYKLRVNNAEQRVSRALKKKIYNYIDKTRNEALGLNRGVNQSNIRNILGINPFQ